jgi:hypothetical protein
MNLESVPNGLREAVARDLAAVRPIHPAWMRTVVSVAVLAVVLAFTLASASLRSDIDQLPMWLSWGCSALQITLGVLLIGMALREAVPGAALPIGSIRWVAVTAVVVQVMVGIATAVYSPAIAVSGSSMATGVGCLSHESVVVLPTFAITLWLVFRALPLRAPVAGLLGGAGASVASDGVLHLICPMSDLRHVLVWHTGAVILFMAAGWTAGLVWARLRWSRSP